MQDLTDVACRARDGDAGALGELVRASITDVRRFCAALVDPGSADDLTQETYLRMMSALPRYRGDAPAAGWLLRIAKHTCVDEIRRRQRRRALEPQLQLVPAAPAPDPAGRLTIELAIAGLSDDRREAFVLTQVLGLSYDEAAASIGCPVGTVRSRVFRARTDLVAAMGDQDERVTPRSRRLRGV